jgi:hypothetical protein
MMIPPPAPEEQTAIRRVIRKIEKVRHKVQLPLVSGAASAVVLFVCLLIAGGLVFLIGMGLHLAPWVRFELVMAVWWLVWTVALARVLYQGVRVSDDLQPHQPRSWFGGGARSSGRSRESGGGNWWYLGDLGGAGELGEGCLWVIGIVLAIGVIVVLAWLLVEIIVPLLAFVFYAMIRGMLARVANDDHECTGQGVKAVLWGAVWATLYTAPLALLVWVIHLIVAYRATQGV